jgi:DedD protein
MNTARPMMDRRLKERLVGATILVALIVLIVPELLSGPKRPGLPPLAAGLPAASRSVVVDLATSKAVAEPESGAASQAAPAVAPNTGAASGASSASGATEESAHPAIAEPGPASSPSVATLKAQNAAQSPLETPASPPKSVSATPRSAAPMETPGTPRRGWAVQLGSFASKANADRLVHRLQGSGGSFYVVPGGSGSSLRYRVRMGPLTDRSAAERALARLKAQGHSGTIVTPAS